MKILLSGSSGFLGAALLRALRDAGHVAGRLLRVRDRMGEQDAFWNPDAGELDPGVLANADAVIHLGGENIAAGRWTPSRKARLRASRIGSTRLLADTVAAMDDPPSVWVCASAVGYYGDRGTEILTEASAPGAGFLAGLCRDWEGAVEPAISVRTRVVKLRFGAILGSGGGMLQRLLTPFRLGVGGPLGDGAQYLSWVSLDDAVAIILAALTSPDLSGPVNAVAPHPVTNAEFTRALGKALGKPTPFRVPRFAARLAFGEMADELLFASQRALPQKFIQTGFGFQCPRLEAALERALAR